MLISADQSPIFPTIKISRDGRSLPEQPYYRDSGKHLGNYNLPAPARSELRSIQFALTFLTS